MSHTLLGCRAHARGLDWVWRMCMSDDSSQLACAAQGLDWVWQMLRVTLARAVAPGRDLPRVIYYDYLDHLDKAAWLGFEHALVVRDRRVDVKHIFREKTTQRLLNRRDEKARSNQDWRAPNVPGRVNCMRCMQPTLIFTAAGLAGIQRSVEKGWPS